MIAHLIHPRSDQLSQAQAFDEGYCTDMKNAFFYWTMPCQRWVVSCEITFHP